MIEKLVFKVGDIVQFFEYEGCSKKDTAIGQVQEALEDDNYRITFGDYKNKKAWHSTSKKHISLLRHYIVTN